MLHYYEMKALDIDDDDEEYFGNQEDRQVNKISRKPSWELKHVRGRNNNLDDSRHNDFDGFEEYFDNGN